MTEWSVIGGCQLELGGIERGGMFGTVSGGSGHVQLCI